MLLPICCGFTTHGCRNRGCLLHLQPRGRTPGCPAAPANETPASLVNKEQKYIFFSSLPAECVVPRAVLQFSETSAEPPSRTARFQPSKPPAAQGLRITVCPRTTGPKSALRPRGGGVPRTAPRVPLPAAPESPVRKENGVTTGRGKMPSLILVTTVIAGCPPTGPGWWGHRDGTPQPPDSCEIWENWMLWC